MEKLILQFMDRYLPRKEIIHRLPIAEPISTFWPELQKARRAKSLPLPLPDQEGKPFWFVLNSSIERQCDVIAELARKDAVFDSPAFDAMTEDAVIDEAIFSSMIEGAFTSREAAIGFLKKNALPTDKSEQMVKNNYDALTYALERLNEPITEKTMIEIARIVTRNASDSVVEGYRQEQVYVMGNEKIVYTPPASGQVPGMMKDLVHFIQNSELHPAIKASIAHFYFVYIHPFADGNGRTARAISYMMLISSGYEFFRYFSISGLVAKERGKYYRAIANVEESESDMTYFIDFYTDMLSRSVKAMEEHLQHHVLADYRIKELEKQGDLNARQLSGAKWLLQGDKESITVEAWRKKFKIVTETARRDLLTLCEHHILERTVEGRKAVFRITR